MIMRIVKNKQIFKSFLVILLFSVIILSLFSIFTTLNYLNNNHKDYTNIDDSNLPLNIRPADGQQPLQYSLISQNVSNVYRLLESIEFEINTSDFTDVDSSIMQIHFSNNTIQNFTMEIVGATNNYTFVYNPEYNAPIGFQRVSFFILNETHTQLNSHTTYVNFTISSNYIAFINSSEYSQGSSVYGELIVNNFKTYTFDWNVAVVNNTDDSFQLTLFTIGDNIGSFLYQINDSFVEYDRNYYVKINMDDSGSMKEAATYLPFKVLNTVPEVIESSVQFSKQEIKRAEDCTISLNITDENLETFPENITVKMYLQQPTGQSISPITLTNNNDWTFSTTFSIDIGNAIGTYQVNFEAEDQYGGIGSYSTTLKVLNNFPTLHNYWINGRAINQRISINYGEDIVFTFNVSDVEDTIEYITVGLLDKNNNWYNITKAYEMNMELIIRSEELLTDVWYVYIAVTDVDGDTTYISSDIGLGPKEIRIIQDLLTPIIPWITLIIGLIFGLLIGLGIVYNRFKSKITEKQLFAMKKKEPSITQKPTKKKVVIEEKEFEEEDVDIEPAEKEGEVKKRPQRKIKRKLN